MKAHDLHGKTFGQWQVLSMLPNRTDDGKIQWICRCSCGYERAIAGTLLASGNTSKCEHCSRTKHGHATRSSGYTRTYRSWNSMRQRCNNPNANRFDRYGGRGITCCERWETFENFLADMGERPAGKTLERIHNSKGYSPENCKWATPIEQGANMDSTKHVHCDGHRISLRQASIIVKRPHSSLSYHLARHGLSIISGHVLVPEWIPQIGDQEVVR